MKVQRQKIIAIIIVLFLAIVLSKTIFKKKQDDLEFVEAEIATVIKEISETGQIKKGEQIELGFKTSGTLEEIYISVGEKVEKKDVLAKLENAQLNIQLSEAQASLQLYQAELNKLIAGATPQEVQVKQTAVDNAQIALDTARQTLEDIKAQGQEDLNAAYQDALNILDDSYLKITDSLNDVDLIQTAYFYKNDQESIIVRENEDKMEDALSKAESYVNIAKDTETNQDIDNALSFMKQTLSDFFDTLKIIRDNCETANYQATVSSSDKSTLDAHRGHINTALTNTVNSQQTISSIKLDNTVNINTYQSQVNIAQGNLKAAQDDLAKLTASPRQEDIDLYQAQVSGLKPRPGFYKIKLKTQY